MRTAIAIGLALATLSLGTKLYASDEPADAAPAAREIETVAGRFVLPVLKLSAADKARLETKVAPFAGLAPAAGAPGAVGMNSIKNIMSPVRNQGGRGTCNVFAAIGLLESTDDEDYSEQCLAKFSSNRDPGWPEQRLHWAFDHGLYRESDCRYDVNRDRIPDLHNASTIAQTGALDEVTPNGDNAIPFVRTKLSEFMPVVVSLYVVGGEWEGRDAVINMPSEDVIKRECTENKDGCPGHSIVITGYDEDTDYLEFRNSWGTGWGRSGYGWIAGEYYRRFHMGNMISLK